MYRAKLSFRLLWLTFLLFSFFSCSVGDYSDLELADSEAEFAFPLFSTDFKIGDLIEQTLNENVDGDTLVVDADGNMTLIYSGDVVEQRAEDLYDLSQFAGGVPIPINDPMMVVPFDTNSNSSLAFVDIYRAEIKGGQITVSGQSNFSEVVTGTVSIPQLSKNGVPYEQDFTVQPGGFILPLTTQLVGYVLTSTSDTLRINYEAFLPDGTAVEFDDNRLFALIQGLEFSYLEGFWGQQLYPLSLDTIEIDINETNFSGGNIWIEDPKVTMRVFNSYGFPTRGNIKTLEFEGSDGVFRELTSPLIIGSALDFEYPKLDQNEVGETKLSEIVFDSDNSNMDAIFNSQPTKLIYEVEGFANATNDPTLIGFITDSSSVRLNVLVELPLKGRVKDFGAESDISIDLSDFDDADNIEEAEFKLITDNEMPVGITGQFYFMDDQDTVIDSLFSTGQTRIMDAAPVDTNGEPTGSQETITFTDMTGDAFEKIVNATKLKMQISFTTTGMGDTNVKLLFDQITKLRMGVKVKTKVN